MKPWVVLRAEALADIEQAQIHFGHVSEELESRFSLELERCIEQIRNIPESHPVMLVNSQLLCTTFRIRIRWRSWRSWMPDATLRSGRTGFRALESPLRGGFDGSGISHPNTQQILSSISTQPHDRSHQLERSRLVCKQPTIRISSSAARNNTT